MNVKNVIMVFALLIAVSCSSKDKTVSQENDTQEFEYVIDRFADVEIMRYQLDDWDNLSLKQKELIYYLSEAALCGRDILFDQNGKYNLLIKRTLENIVHSYSGDKNSDSWQNFMVYVKRFWFSNGMHHHYSNNKFFPDISQDYFASLITSSDEAGFPLKESETLEDFTKNISEIIFSPQIEPIKICQDTKKDLVTHSAVNFYEGVTQK